MKKVDKGKRKAAAKKEKIDKLIDKVRGQTFIKYEDLLFVIDKKSSFRNHHSNDDFPLSIYLPVNHVDPRSTSPMNTLLQAKSAQ